MTKRIVILCVMLCCAFSFAQAQETESTAKTSGSAKSFFSDLDYTVSVGFAALSASEPYDEGKMSFTLGLDARKIFKSYLDDKLGVYGAAGLHLGKKGGKKTSTESGISGRLFQDYFKIRQLSIPLRAGGIYNFKKFQAFVDLGPYFAFALKKFDSEEVKAKGFDVGICYNIGLKFKKKFGISWGMELPFTKLADYTPESGDTKSLKGNTAYFRFQWTFNEWRFKKK